MKVIVEIYAKRGLIDEPLLSRATARIDRCLPFRHLAYDASTWIASTRKIALLTYRVPAGDCEDGKAGDSAPSAADSTLQFTGHVRANVAELRAAAPDSMDELADFSRKLAQSGGLFSAFFANDRLDLLMAQNNITRIEPIYWAENESLVVVGSRALPVHLIARDSDHPRYRVRSLVSFVNAGFFADENTPYEGVKVVPADSVLMVQSGRTQVRAVDDLAPSAHTHTQNSSDYDDIATAFSASFQRMRENPGPIRASLTGGKDSRLILAGLHAAGVDVSAFTVDFGDVNKSDVLVAAEVARWLNVPHQISQRKVNTGDPQAAQTIRVDLLRRTRETLLLTDGMLSTYENVPMRGRYTAQIQFAGSGGEILRGGHARSLLTPAEETLRALVDSHFRSHREWFRESALAEHDAFLDCWFDAQRRSLPILDTLDRFYLHYRCGRWSAAARAGYTPFQELHQPFFDDQLVRLTQQVDIASRLDDRLIYELLIRLAPGLADVPFANDYWRWQTPEQRDAWKNAHPDYYIPRKPVAGGRNTDWRLTFATQLRDEFRNQIFAPGGEALFEILDRDKLAALFDSDQLGNRSNRNFVFHVYTASVLLSDNWIDETGEARPIDVDPNDV